jgi:hypothetical protein
MGATGVERQSNVGKDKVLKDLQKESTGNQELGLLVGVTKGLDSEILNQIN